MIAAAAYEELRSSAQSMAASRISRGGMLLIEEGMASWLSLQLSLVASPSSAESGFGNFSMIEGPALRGVPNLTESREDLILVLAGMAVYQLRDVHP